MHTNQFNNPEPTELNTPPQNGRTGLRHWRHDLLAGLVVSCVSLPLSSGIAIASGAPPIYGIMSAIIAGLVFPFIGGSFVTISGPAAGLAPALYATMAALGGAGDADHIGDGYTTLLAVIFAVGVAQVLMARLGLARFAAVFPASVVEGMLAAIGILILVKAVPLALGNLEPTDAHTFMEYVAAIPAWIRSADSVSITITASCLGVFALLTSKPVRAIGLFRAVPAHVFAVLVGIVLALLLRIDNARLITVPTDPLGGIALPDFARLANSPDLWQAAAIGFVTLTLIDGVESLATAQAIDRIDPYRRKSSPNRVLRAMGLSNVISSLCGGLTVIPGGVKSKTCIEAGGRTLWANFANAIFLLCFLFVAPEIIGLIPKSALGAVLLYTGWKMAHPRIAAYRNGIGHEQLLLYVVTIAITLATDLLVGVLCGTALKYIFILRHSLVPKRRSWTRILSAPFRDPVVAEHRTEGRLTLEIGRPVVCFNAYRLIERIDNEPEAQIVLQLRPGATVVDHTAIESLLGLTRADVGFDVSIEGMARLRPLSKHAHAVRVRSRTPSARPAD